MFGLWISVVLFYYRPTLGEYGSFHADCVYAFFVLFCFVLFLMQW